MKISRGESSDDDNGCCNMDVWLLIKNFFIEELGRKVHCLYSESACLSKGPVTFIDIICFCFV